jgi:hypothetical protein
VGLTPQAAFVAQKCYSVKLASYQTSNLPALLPNAMPMISRFFTEMLKKRQRCVVVNLDFGKVYRRLLYCKSNNYLKISGK